MPCLIQKTSRCTADHTSKTTMLIFHFLYNTKILRENHVYLFYWVSFENCIIFLFSLHKERQTLKELNRNMNNETMVFLKS